MLKWLGEAAPCNSCNREDSIVDWIQQFQKVKAWDLLKAGELAHDWSPGFINWLFFWWKKKLDGRGNPVNWNKEPTKVRALSSLRAGEETGTHLQSVCVSQMLTTLEGGELTSQRAAKVSAIASFLKWLL